MGGCTDIPKLTETIHWRKQLSGLSLMTVTKINGFGYFVLHSWVVAALPIHLPPNHLFIYIN